VLSSKGPINLANEGDEMSKKRNAANSKKDTPEKQHARFVEAAKRAEADEAPDAMDKAFKKLAPMAKKSSGRPN
jgi:hypothetical protein